MLPSKLKLASSQSEAISNPGRQLNGAEYAENMTIGNKIELHPFFFVYVCDIGGSPRFKSKWHGLYVKKKKKLAQWPSCACDVVGMTLHD